MPNDVNYNCDAAVVGAGPAGATAAYILAKKGYKVIVIDKEKFPRQKLCGGALTVKTIRLLERVFNEAEDSLLAKNIIDFKAGRFEIRYRSEILISKESAYPFYFVDRSVYDNFLLQKAKQSGAEVLPSEKVIELNSDQRELRTSTGKLIKANFIIGADGANSMMRSRLYRENKIDGSRWQRNLAYAVEAFPERGKDHEALTYPILSYGYINYGYAWIFPNKKGLAAGMGGLKRKNKNKDITKIFRAFLADFKLDSSGTIRIRGHPLPFGNFLLKPVWGKILLAGDAAGLVDPMLGEGIYQAHRSGELAARAIIEQGNNPEDNYLSLLNTHLIPEFTYARRLRWFAYNKLNHLTKFRCVKWVENHFDKLVELVHGGRSYKRPWRKR